TVTDDKLVAIPYSSIRWEQTSDNQITPRIDATTASLDAAPRVEVHNYDVLNDAKFVEQVNKSFPAAQAK
ncbi:MAG: hypothetical protein ACRDD1_20565, partial [Planctomycetia bacterium]